MPRLLVLLALGSLSTSAMINNNGNGHVGEQDAAALEEIESARFRKEGEEEAVQACYLLLAGDLARARARALRGIYLLTVARSMGASQSGPQAP